MDLTVTVWGLVAIISGGFFAIYGFTLFRIALLCIGFLIGFSLAMGLTASQPEFVRILASLVGGGIVGGLLFLLFRLSIYIAGGVLGIAIALLVLSFLNIGDGILSSAIVIVGIGVCGFFGRLLGELIIVLSTSVVGSYAIVYGITLLFPDTFGADVSRLGTIPISALTLALIVIFGLVSGLAQHQIMRLRQRLQH